MNIDLNIKRQPINARSVLVRDHTIPVLVKKLYTDVDGVVIAKNTIPVAMQKKVPAFLLGEFDRQGGYKIGAQATGLDAGLKYLMSFINGNGAGIHSVVGFSGLATIGNYIATGDIVTVFCDSLINPGYFVWIIVQNNYASIASIIGNTESSQNDRRIGPIVITEFHIQTDTESQLSQAIKILHYSNIGTWRTNSIDPLGMYRTPMDVQEGLIRIPVKPLFLDQYFGLAFNMLYECDEMHIDFKVVTE
jgi:hypothetical protein